METMIKNQMEMEEIKSMVIEEMNAFDEFISTINTVKKKKKRNSKVGDRSREVFQTDKHETENHNSSSKS